MQNLAKYPKQKYVTSMKLFGTLRKYDTWHETIINTRLIHSCIRNEMNRLYLPLSYKTYKQFHKELNAIQTLFVQNGFHNLYNLSTLCNTRDFCTNSSNKRNIDGNSSKESSGGSDKNPKNDEEIKHIFNKLLWVLLIFGTITTIITRQKLDDESQKLVVQVPWNEFVYHFLAKGEVKSLVIHPSSEIVVIVVHEGAVIKGERARNKRYTLHIADINNLEEKVRKAEKDLGIHYGDGIPIVYNRTIERDFRIMTYLLTFLLLLYFFRIFKSGSFKNPLDVFSNLRQAKFTLVEPTSTKGVRFEDVAGLQEAKTEVMEFVDYLKRPERYKTLGAKVPKGALLLGPPGCGKTMLAKAVASESDVPFLSMNGSEFVEMIGGLGAARVRSLFKEGKKRAPSIIYIDEIDAIGKKRSAQEAQFSNSESERTLIQLLVEMDGMTTNEDVIILASTNRADVLDKALLRPGRFDRHILIDLPTLQERKQIFERHLKTLVLEGKPSKYSGYLAHLTPGFSGADIANICNEAALHAARFMKTSVDGTDLTYAIDRVIAGPEKKTNTLTPSTKKVVAYHEAGHALVGWLLEHTDALLKVTIVPRTALSLGFAQYSDSNQKLHSTEQLFEKMCMMLGGRVAEYIMFDEISTGAENDLKKVTQIAYRQVQQFGMSSNIGLISFDEEITSTKNIKPYSKKLGNYMDSEVRNIIGDAYKATQKLLTDNKDKLTAIAEALLQKETLTYDDVEKLIGPPPFGKKRLVEPAEFEKLVTEPELRTPEPSPS